MSRLIATEIIECWYELQYMNGVTITHGTEKECRDYYLKWNTGKHPVRLVKATKTITYEEVSLT